ncbi:MAG: MMPL family transporter [Candidatus Sericytochromatia bacterium]|nr:MMPL family transporter [Candidatus Sericytochromatia bacterium]
MLLAALIAFAHRHHRVLLLIWLLGLTLAVWQWQRSPGAPAETELSGASQTPAARVIEILKQDFGLRLGSSAAIVLPAGIPATELLQRLPERFDVVQQLTPVPAPEAGGQKWQLLRLDFAPDLPVVEAQALTPALRTFLQDWGSAQQVPVYLTGNTAFQHDAKVESRRDSRRGESLALLISLVILVLNFGALSAALLPLLMGVSSLIGLNSLVLNLGLSVNPVAQVLTSLVGLALSIDYALFLVSRFREESAQHSPRKALQIALQQAGHTILFSGLIMLCSLAVLLIPDVSLSRTVMLHLLLVIALALFHALVILPLLLLLGARWLNWPAGLSQRIQRVDSTPFWLRFSTHVVDHYRGYFVLSVCLLGLLAWPATRLQLWEPVQGVAPQRAESMQAYEALKADGWGGELLPVVLVAEHTQGVFAPDFLAWLYTLDRQLAALPEVARVQSLVSGAGALAEYQALYQSLNTLGFLGRPPALERLVNASNQRTVLYVFPRDGMALADSRAILQLARREAAAAPYPLYVGGVVARVQDFTHELYRQAPLMLGLILLSVCALLWWQMGTPVLPIKAALMNFLPILGAFGLLVLGFQEGWGQGLGLPDNGAITNIVPLVLFCIVFGLSMDYEVLILSRVSEHYRRCGDVREAVIEGLSRSGSVITGAVLILLGVFLPGVFSSSAQTQEICVGLVVAIVLDATVVRLLLVPSFMLLLGRWNWWPSRPAPVSKPFD